LRGIEILIIIFLKRLKPVRISKLGAMFLLLFGCKAPSVSQTSDFGKRQIPSDPSSATFPITEAVLEAEKKVADRISGPTDGIAIEAVSIFIEKNRTITVQTLDRNSGRACLSMVTSSANTRFSDETTVYDGACSNSPFNLHGKISFKDALKKATEFLDNGQIPNMEKNLKKMPGAVGGAPTPEVTLTGYDDKYEKTNDSGQASESLRQKDDKFCPPLDWKEGEKKILITFTKKMKPDDYGCHAKIVIDTDKEVPACLRLAECPNP
jgi:hypothetical protein